MVIRCLIVDDEHPARDELRFLLSRYPDIEVIGEADSASTAVAAIRRTQPDLIFLDIQLGSRDGFEVVRELQGTARMPLVVFATAYDHYAVRAFEESAVDYVLKPLAPDRLDRTIERVRSLLKEQSRPKQELEHRLQSLLAGLASTGERVRISVEKSGRIQLLSPGEIVYCSCEANRIMVHTRDNSLPLYGIATMDRLAEHLGQAPFFRAHRAVLVNLDHIAEFSPWFNGKYNLIMNDAQRTEITVSRTRVKAFKERLGL